MNFLTRGALVFFLVFGLLISASVYNVRQTEAAIPVIDMQNIKEAMATVAEITKTVTNTAEMIKNQVKNLTSLPKEILESTKSGINKSISEMIQPVKEVKGLTGDIKNAEQSWKDTFESIENIKQMAPYDYVQHGYKMSETMEKTYQDTLKIQGLVAQIEQDQKQLDELLKANANASGAKDLAQLANQINAISVQQSMRQQQITAATTRAQLAELGYQNQVLMESQVAAEKESAAWQEIGNRTTEQIEEQTKPAHRYKPVF